MNEQCVLYIWKLMQHFLKQVDHELPLGLFKTMIFEWLLLICRMFCNFKGQLVNCVNVFSLFYIAEAAIPLIQL